MEATPSRAVVDFAQAAGVMGNIPVRVAAIFDQSGPIQPALPPPPQPTPTSTARPKPKKPLKPSPGPAEDASEQSLTAGKGKGKSIAAPDVVTPRPTTPSVMPRGLLFDGVDTGVKRGPPTSPPSVATSAKRSRTTGKSRSVAYDLSELVVTEGTSPADRVPEVVGAVSLHFFVGYVTD